MGERRYIPAPPGEDGPTHQTVEALGSLRSTPNILLLRPADGNEVSGAYILAVQDRRRPTVLSLSRQNVDNLEGTDVDKVKLGTWTGRSPTPRGHVGGTNAPVRPLGES